MRRRLDRPDHGRITSEDVPISKIPWAQYSPNRVAVLDGGIVVGTDEGARQQANPEKNFEK